MSIAYLLSGKHKPTQRSHIDVGDSVVVVNCEKVRFRCPCPLGPN